ncbi:MAG: copper-translocating P-type ATPase [Rhodobacteraceae bacterium]|nr:copper-translocating P-type ATPase [Paracoccaceae bacterium]
MVDVTIRVENMTCASCVARVEKALGAVEGVQKAEVNLASEAARVHFDAPADLGVLERALSKAGYPVVTEDVVLAIDAMTCASCVGRVEEALADAPGVMEVSVNLASETAHIRVAAGQISGTDLARLAGAAGYPARVLSGSDAGSVAERKAEEAVKLGRLTLLAAVMALPVFVVEMGGHIYAPIHHWIAANIGLSNSHLIQFVLATLVMAGPGRRFYLKGIPLLLRGKPDMNSLVALGTLAAYGFSVISTFAPHLLPQGTVNVYYEAAVVIIVLILFGRWMEARAKGRTGAAISQLLKLAPNMAQVERAGGAIEEVAAEELVVGDIVHLRPGGRVPVDGEVVSGTSWVDESMITGEPVPVKKEAGGVLIAGCVNGSGAMTLRATRVGADTTLAQIVRLVEQAQAAKLPIQSLVDKITAYFVPAVMAAAALTVLIWLAIGPSPALGYAMVAGVAVLIIACPCAMGLATPTSIMVGTGRGAQMGVLFRKGDALQSLQEVSVVAMDKTGTLTQGRPDLTDIAVADGFDENEVMRLLAAAESGSEHPIAGAIIRAAKARGLDITKAENTRALPGFGLSATVEGRSLLAGAERLLTRKKLDPGALAGEAARWATRGRTPLYVVLDGQVAAVVAVADPIKPSTPAAIAALHQLGLKVVMITGDNAATATAIARDLGIDDVVSEVLPKGKVEALQALRAGGAKLAFVGDGINDAPALASADVGIAIGTGTDVAIEAADVVLVSGDLAGVVNATSLSRATMRNIRQNLFWAFGYNVVLIPVAAGLLFPIWGILLSPMLGAGAMAMSSIFVLANALRLRNTPPFLRRKGESA